jgi:hypothetical protein
MNPLQDLKDIRIPAVIENWPLAYGWWLLLSFIILGICLLALWLVKFRKVRIAKRQALRALQQIDASSLNSVSQLNQLLKRVTMEYFPNHNVQEMYGKKWTEFLAGALPSSKSKNFFESFELMQNELYQVHATENILYARYSKSIETWIKSALPPKKNIVIRLEQNNA